MLNTPTVILVANDRRQEALAWADRTRLVAAATEPSPAAAPRPVGLVRAGLRQTVAALVALAAIDRAPVRPRRPPRPAAADRGRSRQTGRAGAGPRSERGIGATRIVE